MTISDLTQLWTPVSAVLAIAAGIAYGWAVGQIATNPTYSAGLAGPLRVAFLTALFSASAGLVFFAGQALGSYLSEDPNWPRVMSRYGQWILFSLTIGATTWALVRHDRALRRRRAHERAIAELESPQ